MQGIFLYWSCVLVHLHLSLIKKKYLENFDFGSEDLEFCCFLLLIIPSCAQQTVRINVAAFDVHKLDSCPCLHRTNSFFVRRRVIMPALNLHRLLPLLVLLYLIFLQRQVFLPLCVDFYSFAWLYIEVFLIAMFNCTGAVYPLFRMWIHFQLFTVGIIMRTITIEFDDLKF